MQGRARSTALMVVHAVQYWLLCVKDFLYAKHVQTGETLSILKKKHPLLHVLARRRAFGGPCSIEKRKGGWKGGGGGVGALNGEIGAGCID